MDSVNGKSKEMKNFYILSMGHRIHFMQYDGEGVSSANLVVVVLVVVLVLFYFFCLIVLNLLF